LMNIFRNGITELFLNTAKTHKLFILCPLVLPGKRHRAVGKKSGETNHIERLNNTFRQRISRFVRKSLSFSKKMDNHIGAIWYFIHDYNAQLARN